MAKRRKKTPQPKSKGGVKIGRVKVQQMWSMFQAGVSCQAISRAVSVSRPTVMRYRRIEKWVERRDAITERAKVKADDVQVTRLAESMKIVRYVKGTLLDQIKAMAEKKEELSKIPVTDMIRVIECEERLHGMPDIRIQHDYSKMTEEQLTIEFEATMNELNQITDSTGSSQNETQDILKGERGDSGGGSADR